MNKYVFSVDSSLRPTDWDSYVGQHNSKKLLRVSIDAAKKRKHNIEHILLYGSAGLGKTTLAQLLALEMDMFIQTTSGPMLERPGDLVALLSSFEKPSILFIDEIHRIPKTVEETLYPVMESGSLSIMVGKGVSARSVDLSFPPCTILGATTRLGMLSKPLLSRFSGGVLHLLPYTEEEIRVIIRQSACVLSIDIDEEALTLLSQRSRNTPRIANNLLKRSRDLADVLNSKITEKIAQEAMNICCIDGVGLTAQDYILLNTIHQSFNDGPVGINTLAATLGEQEITIEEYLEPFLLQIGFIERTPRGRIVTEKAKKHLKKENRIL